jgi:membrane fusion protein, copper/silver efflux system
MIDKMQLLLSRLAATLRLRWKALPARVRHTAPYAGILVVGLVLGYLLFGRSDGLVHDADGPQLTEAGDEGAVIWTCSMHPSVRQPGPGKCPICGMDLIPASNDGADDHGDLPRLTVSERAAALMAVQVWPAERRGMTGDVSLFGRIDYDETRVHDVVLRTDGQIERLHVNYANAPVRQGQALAEVYSPAILSASQELLQARRAAEAGGSPALVEAARSQLQAMGVGEAQIERILETGQPARTYTLHSPSAGVVSDLTARQGEWLMAGARVMRVAGVGSVWAQFEAFERDLGRLRVGRPLTFTVEAFPGETFQGAVAFIDPVVDGARRTARVRVQVQNPGGRLMPGMLARGMATGTPSPDAPLVIPTSAPLLTGSRAVVYVQLPGFDRPTFEGRDVTLGKREGEFWEVTEGLSEGDLVVVNGAFKIDSELQIRGRPSMMMPPVMPASGAEERPLPQIRTDPVTLSQADGRRLEDIARAYLDVAGALSQDNAEGARRAAGVLEAALEATDFGNLDREAGREWNLLRREMRASAATMARASNIDVLRGELLPLSIRIDTAVRTFRSDQVGALFRAMCPMVDGGNGYWLTRVERVENPYHGAAMFACGEVQEKVAG